MIQDIAPHVFRNEYRAIKPCPQSLAVCCEAGRLLVVAAGDGFTLPSFAGLGLEPGLAVSTYLFSVDGRPCFLTEPPGLPPEGAFWADRNAFREAKPRWMALAGVTALQLEKWYRQNRFCGCCGHPAFHHPNERALVCEPCGITLYPKISPAVIVAVTDGDRLLLSRYAGRANGRYALIAGFAEIGESIEDTVRREVMEEVGLRVKNLRFYKSQPWAFSDSLLLGFFCELDGPSAITLDRTELAEAGWFAREEVPPAVSDISLTSEMMELFRLGRGESR